MKLCTAFVCAEISDSLTVGGCRPRSKVTRYAMELVSKISRVFLTLGIVDVVEETFN